MCIPMTNTHSELPKNGLLISQELPNLFHSKQACSRSQSYPLLQNMQQEELACHTLISESLMDMLPSIGHITTKLGHFSLCLTGLINCFICSFLEHVFQPIFSIFAHLDRERSVCITNPTDSFHYPVYCVTGDPTYCANFPQT